MSVLDPQLAPAESAQPEKALRARLRRRPPLVVLLGAVFLALVLLCALVPGLLEPEDPDAILPAQGLLGPSAEHLLGTDQLGRDVFSRLIAGARTALLGPLFVAAVAVLLSTAIALVAGYVGGWVDTLVGRVIDTLYALPELIVAIVLVGVFGGGYWMAIAVLIVFGMPRDIRILRAAVIERRGLPYVEAARTLGVPTSRIMFGHLLPNIVPVIVTCFFLAFTYGIMGLSALSFLGLGVPPGSSDWGRMVAENRIQLAQNPWASVAPCIALVLTVLSANFVGDWAYDQLERRRRAR